MNPFIFRALALAGLGFVALAGQARAAPLKLVITTPMPGFDGDFDHFGADVAGNRLFLAAENAKTVEIFDLKTGARSGTISGFGHPLNMHYLADSNQLLVTDGGFPDGAPGGVQLVDCGDYKIVKTAPLPAGVDHGAFNPVDQRYYVESGSENGSKETHLLNAIDLKSFRRVARVVVPGESNEGMVIDRAGKTLYVNLTGTDEVGVVNLRTMELVARWPLPAGAHTAHAIALDEANRRLFTVSRKPGEFIVLNLDTGKVVTTLPCVGVNSDISRDLERHRLYVTGTGTVSVYQQDGADDYTHLAEVPSAFRAKSSIFIPRLNRLYVAASGKGAPGTKLALLIFEAQ